MSGQLNALLFIWESPNVAFFLITAYCYDSEDHVTEDCSNDAGNVALHHRNISNIVLIIAKTCIALKWKADIEVNYIKTAPHHLI